MTGSESPTPRLSTNSSRPRDASRMRKCANRGSSQQTSQWDIHPGMKTMSSGPSPTAR